MIDVNIHRTDAVNDKEFTRFVGSLNAFICGESWDCLVTVDTPDEVPINHIGQIFFRVSVDEGNKRWTHKSPSELRKTVKMLIEHGRPIDQIKIDLVTDITVSA